MSSTDLALIAHLMRRAGFGSTRAELEEFAEQSYEEIVEDLLHPERFPEVADDIVVRYWMELNNPGLSRTVEHSLAVPHGQHRASSGREDGAVLASRVCNLGG